MVADTKVCADALGSCLRGDDALEVVATTVWRNADRPVSELEPDVVVVHVAYGGGIAAIRELRGSCNGSRLVALGVSENDAEVVAFAEAGASAYLPSGGTVAELAEVVRRAARGEALSSPRIVAALFERLADHAAARRHAPNLTPRELQVIRLVADGLSNKEIAERLCLELSTVKNHVHNALKKLGVSRRGEAAHVLRSSLRD